MDELFRWRNSGLQLGIGGCSGLLRVDSNIKGHEV